MDYRCLEGLTPVDQDDSRTIERKGENLQVWDTIETKVQVEAGLEGVKIILVWLGKHDKRNQINPL